MLSSTRTKCNQFNSLLVAASSQFYRSWCAIRNAFEFWIKTSRGGGDLSASSDAISGRRREATTGNRPRRPCLARAPSTRRSRRRRLAGRKPRDIARSRSGIAMKAPRRRFRRAPCLDGNIGKGLYTNQLTERSPLWRVAAPTAQNRRRRTTSLYRPRKGPSPRQGPRKERQPPICRRTTIRHSAI